MHSFQIPIILFLYLLWIWVPSRITVKIKFGIFPGAFSCSFVWLLSSLLVYLKKEQPIFAECRLSHPCWLSREYLSIKTHKPVDLAPHKLMLRFDILSWSPMVQERERERGSIPGRIIPKTKKWYLIQPCLTLSSIRWESSLKRSNPGNGVSPSPTPHVTVIENGAFGSPSTKVVNFTKLP